MLAIICSTIDTCFANKIPIKSSRRVENRRRRASRPRHVIPKDDDTGCWWICGLKHCFNNPAKISWRQNHGKICCGVQTYEYQWVAEKVSDLVRIFLLLLILLPHRYLRHPKNRIPHVHYTHTHTSPLRARFMDFLVNRQERCVIKCFFFACSPRRRLL